MAQGLIPSEFKKLLMVYTSRSPAEFSQYAEQFKHKSFYCGSAGL
jgi:hypothetical protein